MVPERAPGRRKCGSLRAARGPFLQTPHQMFVATGGPTMQIVDFSNIQRHSVREYVLVESRCGKRRPAIYDPRQHRPRQFQPRRPIGLSFENCQVSDFTAIDDVLPAVLFYPEMLTYLDLRSNRLNSIEFLDKLPNLAIIYLQNNLLETEDCLEPLHRQPRLKSLTLHGNPIMADPLAFYRLVLAFPNVVSFNLRHISQ